MDVKQYRYAEDDAENDKSYLDIDDLDSEPGDVVFSQETFIKTLNPVTVVTKRGEGRTQDTPLLDKEQTDFRSLTCGIAWVGITSVHAQSASSLYQDFSKDPAISQGRVLNTFLEQLQTTYVLLRFSRKFFRDRPENIPMRALVFSDSSFNNRPGNYPQAAQLIFLAYDRTGTL